MYSYNAEDSATPLACAEAAYSAMEAAIIFYEGLRVRSWINTDTLAELRNIKDAIRHAMFDSRGSQIMSGASLDSISTSLRRLISTLYHGSSAPSTFSYAGQMYPSSEVNDQLGQYLRNAQKWLKAAKSVPSDTQTDEGASGTRSSAPYQNQPTDTGYYTMDYSSRLWPPLRSLS